MRTKLAALCLMITAAACGGGNGPAGDRAADDRSPGATTRAQRTQAPDSEETPNVTRAPEGRVNRPKAGRYVYALRGSNKFLDSEDRPTRTPPNARTTHDISNDGDTTTMVETTSIGPTRLTVRQRWEDDRVVQLSGESAREGEEAGCEYDPPLEILRIPLQATKLPEQPIRGTGSACGGTIQVEIAGRETTTDWSGRKWSAWKIVLRTSRGTGDEATTTTETRWFSPDLGKDVRIDGVTEGSVPSDEGRRRYRSETKNVLTSYPS